MMMQIKVRSSKIYLY